MPFESSSKQNSNFSEDTEGDDEEVNDDNYIREKGIHEDYSIHLSKTVTLAIFLFA